MAAMAYQPYGSYSNSSTMRGPDQETPNRRRRPQNTESVLLSDAENQTLFESIGSNAVCLSAGVAELLRASGGRWTRPLRGVIAMVKDYDRRAYFLRMIDILNGNPLWEFNVYTGFESVLYPPQLLTFEGESDSHIYGLNFSSPREAETFKEHLDKRSNQEKKNVAPRMDKPYRPPAPAAPSSSTTMPFKSTPSIAPNVRPHVPGVSPFNASGITVAHPSMTTITRDTPKSGGTLFSMKKKNDKKKKIRKEDISNPTNFQHKAHVGWDQDSGFSNNADPDPMDDTIKTILKAAGQDPSQMSKKTIKFVYDFIEKYQEAPEGQIQNGVGAYPPHQSSWGSSSSRPSPSISSPLPPAPPSRITSHSPSIAPPSRPPPPPPSSIRPLPFRPQDGPPLPPPIHSSPSTPPPPPPPPSLPPIASSAPPPPPPPPPPPIMSGPPPPPPPPGGPPSSSAPPARNNLLAEIQAGKALKSVGDQQERKSNGADSRDDVMAQIRMGTSLKPVDKTVTEKRKSGGLDTVGGLAGALAKALEERRMNMGMDDDDDDDGDKDSENDWSD